MEEQEKQHPKPRPPKSKEKEKGKEKEKEKVKLRTVFIGSFPKESGKQMIYPTYIDSLSTKDRIVLHPAYDFNSEEGKRTIERICATPPLDCGHTWENAVNNDVWCIKRSELFIQDLDFDNNFYQMAYAAALNKPIIAVSNVLASVPVYFSGIVERIIKPRHLLENIDSIYDKLVEE